VSKTRHIEFSTIDLAKFWIPEKYFLYLRVEADLLNVGNMNSFVLTDRFAYLTGHDLLLVPMIRCIAMSTLCEYTQIRAKPSRTASLA